VTLSLTRQAFTGLGSVASLICWQSSRPASSPRAPPLSGDERRPRGGAWLDRRDDRGDQSGKGGRRGICSWRLPAIRLSRLPARRLSATTGSTPLGGSGPT